MKLTKSKLKQIIQEELHLIMEDVEKGGGPGREAMGDWSKGHVPTSPPAPRKRIKKPNLDKIMSAARKRLMMARDLLRQSQKPDEFGKPDSETLHQEIQAVRKLVHTYKKYPKHKLAILDMKMAQSLLTALSQALAVTADAEDD